MKQPEKVKKGQKVDPVVYWTGSLDCIMVQGRDLMRVVRVKIDAESGAMVVTVGGNGFFLDEKEREKIKWVVRYLSKILDIPKDKVLIAPAKY